MVTEALGSWLQKLRRLAQRPAEARLLARRDIVSRGANIGGEVLLEAPCNLNNAALSGTISIGAFTYCNDGVAITNADIGRYCSIGQGVIINPGQHPTNFLTTHPFSSDISNLAAGLPMVPAYAGLLGSRLDFPSIPMSRHRLTIGHDVWIGARAMIMGGVHIGTGAIIGAGAVVTRDVPPHAVVVGMPARVIGLRLAPELSEAALASHWWDWDLTSLTREIDYSDVASAISLIQQASADERLKKFAPRRHRFTRNGPRLRVEDLG